MAKYIAFFITFILCNYSIIGTGVQFTPFYAMQTILVPYNYDTGNIHIMAFSISILICYIFIITIVNEIQNMFYMYGYIHSRASKSKMFIIIYLKVIKSLAILFVIKFIADILLGQPTGLINIEILLKYNILMILTITVWYFIIFILYTTINSTKIATIISLCVVLFIQTISLFVQSFGVMSIANQSSLDKFVLFVSLKIIIIFVLGLYSYVIFNKYEYLGDKDND